MDFYRVANEARNDRYDAGDRSAALPELPFLDEWDMPAGRRTFLYPCDFYDHLRPHIPHELRTRLDTAFGAVLPGWGVDWIPDNRDDLSADAATDPNLAGDLYYALRPTTAHAIASIDIPWDDLYRLEEQHPHPDPRYLHVEALRSAAAAHLNAVADAATRGRGVIGLITH